MSEFFIEDPEEYRSDNFLNFKAEFIKTTEDFNIYESQQEQYLLIYSHSGEGILDYLGENYKLSAGTGFFIDCRNLHYVGAVGDDWCITRIYMSGRNADWLYKLFKNGNSIFFTIDNTEKFLKYFNAVIKRSKPISILSKLVLSHYLIQLIIFIRKGTRPSQFVPSYLVHLKEMLENNYHDSGLRKAPQNYLGVNSATIEREFVLYYEYTPAQYINYLRLKEAKTLLEDSDYTLSTISEMTGFSSLVSMLYIFCIMDKKLPHYYRSKFNHFN